MSLTSLQASIERHFAAGPAAIGDPAAMIAFLALRSAIENGQLRSASPDPASPTGWSVNAWVKQGILLGFRLGVLESFPAGELYVRGQAHLPRPGISRLGRRPPRSRRLLHPRRRLRGPERICMPPMYINAGAYVNEGTMVNSHALVGSCAQIGKRVHLSAAAQIGGVLEPINAGPVVIEDDVLVGGNCGVYEGTIVRKGAVLAAGTILTRGTPVFDL